LEPRATKAKELFLEGYNCAQSMLGAYCDEAGIDFEQAIKLTVSFRRRYGQAARGMRRRHRHVHGRRA
jgi:hypothetical protein